ncbi:aspartate/glutamate racemase family protein [Auraticoccus monumenti]|uniref:Aspartate racemase n=1 Tax=Auraticoccus monumenti TaxID=675864 RepID=A0A1G6THP0_9ACTN|nr:aspartate/glutamate racemase family protein [Auraticoccus monumenti]SDD28590.1 aspartate racemase [Auraticoccus monumenti]
MEQTRTIGLIGGMSWESSIEYYRLTNELVARRLGGFHSARSILHSVDFAEIERLQVTGDWAAAGRVLADAARAVELAGADFVVLCTNTMHKVAADIEAAVSIPLLHIADATADAVQAQQLTTVGLLATAFTMEQTFYRERLERRGLRVLVPGEEDRRVVHRVIYEELVLGEVRDASRREYRRIMSRLVADGAEGIILGCTEIELLVGQADSSVPVFPTTRIHAEAAVDAAFA